MEEILISKTTNKHINLFVKKPGHSLIIKGLLGYGKYTLARYISTLILGLDNVRLNNYQYYFELKTDSSIGIDDIKELGKFFALKTLGSGEIKRIALIENAHLMTNEAQNALLKLLEEPPLDSLIILTVNSDKNLKETVVSRCQMITITRPKIDQTVNFFKQKGYSQAEIERNYKLSNGAIGLTSMLLNTEETSPIIRYVEEAKKLLTLGRFEKMTEVNSIIGDKDKMEDRLYALKRVVHAALRQSIGKQDTKNTKRWFDALKLLGESEIYLRNGLSTKLVLTNLLFSL